MPISRASATRLRKDSMPYTAIPNDTVWQIRNPDALAIWVYLQTRPVDWTVRVSELRERFNLGRDRSARAMRDLKALGLISYAELRNADGRLCGSVLHVHYAPLTGDAAEAAADPKAETTLKAKATPKTKTAPKPETTPKAAEANNVSPEANGPLSLLDQDDATSRMTQAFETFYNAGLPKKARRTAEKAFQRAAKSQADPLQFAEMLAANIQARLIAGELGFAKMHPSTYLNQERWLDETAHDTVRTSVHGCPDQALYELFAEVMRERGLTHKVPKQGFDMFRNTRGHEEMLARWDQLFGTTNPKGRLRYDDEGSGLAFWRYAIETVADKQNFRQSDVTISTFFHRDVFHRAIEGTLRQHGAAR